MLFIAWLVFTCIGFCMVQSQIQAKHAHVELLAGARSNAKILLGVRFQLEPGWHIYWTNPGDSGQPPSFHWTLPAGATAGEIHWPLPERLQTSPTIVDYGYKHDVLLMVPLRFAGLEQNGSGLNVALEAKWLICREVCLPDHARLTLPLPAQSKDPHTAQLFASAKALLPRPWPKQWKATVQSRKDEFLVTIVTGRPLTRAGFFPLDSGQIDNAANQQLTTTPTGASLILKKSDLLLKPVPEVRGVLVLGKTAYQFHAPVLSPHSALK